MGAHLSPTYRPRRNFDPKRSYRHGSRADLSPDELVKYSPKHKYSRLLYCPYPFRISGLRPQMNTIVLQVQGIAKGNHIKPAGGKPGAMAAWGVSLGLSKDRRASTGGLSGVVPSIIPQTNHRAMLEAVRKAVIAGLMLKESASAPVAQYRRTELILMLNSDYIVKLFDEWIWHWERKRDRIPTWTVQNIRANEPFLGTPFDTRHHKGSPTAAIGSDDKRYSSPSSRSVSSSSTSINVSAPCVSFVKETRPSLEKRVEDEIRVIESSESVPYVTAKGKKVVHWQLVQEIHRLICYLENEANVSVRFWRVDRSAVAQANDLAEQAVLRARAI